MKFRLWIRAPEEALQNKLRAPELNVSLNGINLSGVIAVDIESSGHFAADRFRIRFAARVVPQDAVQIPGSRIEVLLGIDNVWVSVLVGTIDTASMDVTSGTFDVEGRDLSSLLIESQADETFANSTSSEIAAMFAARHGLDQSITRTTTPTGRYYQSEHDRLTLGQFSKATTEWDLLAYLATREGFDLSVEGSILSFGPPATTNAVTLTPTDCTSLQLEHCIGLARPINVTVKSWGSTSGQSVTAVSEALGKGPIWARSMTRPNLTSDDAKQLAMRVISDLKRHEWTASVTMPGELALTTRTNVALSGTGTAWDRQFRVVQLTRNIDSERGFTQHLTLQGIE